MKKKKLTVHFEGHFVCPSSWISTVFLNKEYHQTFQRIFLKISEVMSFSRGPNFPCQGYNYSLYESWEKASYKSTPLFFSFRPSYGSHIEN